MQSVCLAAYLLIHFPQQCHDPSAPVCRAAVGPEGHVIPNFGADLGRLYGVAVPGSFASQDSWGLTGESHYNFESQYFPLNNPQLDEATALTLLRSSVLHAEFVHNRKRQVLAAHGLKLLAYSGGPALQAAGYGSRGNLFAANRCLQLNSWPCTISYPPVAKNYVAVNYATANDLNATMPELEAWATAEQHVEDVLIAAQRRDVLKDLMIDHMERWRRLGGGDFVVQSLLGPPTRCLTGGKGCGNNALLESPHGAGRNGPVAPKWAGVQAFMSGSNASELPFTSADLETAPSTPIPCDPTCRWGTCFRGSCRCFAGYAGNSCDQKVPKANDCTADVGMNIGGIADWSTEWAFVDVHKSSRDWVAQEFTSYTWNTDTELNVTDDGYLGSLKPNQLAGSMMVRDLQGHYPAGTYIVLYDGDGIIHLSMDDVVTYRRQVGRIEVDVEPTTGGNNGIFLTVERTNPEDPVRNIRVVMPGFEELYNAFPFHPLFLKSLEKYQVVNLSARCMSGLLQSVGVQ